MEKDIPEYKVFEGAKDTQMSLLRTADRVPASAAWIMQAFLDDKLPGWNCGTDLWSFHFDSGDVVVTHPDGKVKLAHDSPLLYIISQQSTYEASKLILPDGAYERINGPELSEAQIDQHAGNQYTGDLSRSAVMNHPVWQFLAKENKVLLKEYASKMFSCLKKTYNTREAMAIKIAPLKNIISPTMHLWRLHGTGYLRQGRAIGDSDENNGYERFFGLVTPNLKIRGSPYRTNALMPMQSLEDNIISGGNGNTTVNTTNTTNTTNAGFVNLLLKLIRW